MKQLICWIVGHRAWVFSPNGNLMWFKQNPASGDSAYSVEICTRCCTLFATPSSWVPPQIEASGINLPAPQVTEVR
jgi:hypothetical protein